VKIQDWQHHLKPGKDKLFFPYLYLAAIEQEKSRLNNHIKKNEIKSKNAIHQNLQRLKNYLASFKT
jgi:hypothetical protein